MTDDDTPGTTRDQAIEVVRQKYEYSPGMIVEALSDAGLLRGGGDTGEARPTLTDQVFEQMRTDVLAAEAEVEKLRAERDQQTARADRNAEAKHRAVADLAAVRGRVEALADEASTKAETLRGLGLPDMAHAANAYEGMAGRILAALGGESDGD